MPVTGLNHVTLAVSDLDRSIAFYRDILGAQLRADWADGAYLELGSLWLCLARGKVETSKDYSHVALSCPEGDFAELSSRLHGKALIWQENSSEGDSVYFLDPDGHKLELHLGSLNSRLAHYSAHPEKRVRIHD